HSKTFVAGSFDTSRIAPETWELKLPEANSNEDLILQTDGILDLYSLTNGLRITDISGREIEGKYETGQGEVIRFIPSKNWKSGEYMLLIDNNVEDLAGNRRDRLFDNNLERDTTDHKSNDHIKFSIN
ncbi:MAG: hypothetical protein P8X57_12310, partial [Cyclobacteriaceae bacterium]